MASTPITIPRLSHWATDFRATNHSHWDILQGHADYCAQWGHATYTVDGVVQGWCPRCGVRL